MPVIVVHGIPSRTRKEMLQKITDTYQRSLAEIKELGLEKDQTSVFFVPDLLEEGLGEEIIIFVRGLYEKPERTESVLLLVASVLGFKTKNLYFKNALVECFVETIPTRRCWSSAEKYKPVSFTPE